MPTVVDGVSRQYLAEHFPNALRNIPQNRSSFIVMLVNGTQVASSDEEMAEIFGASTSPREVVIVSAFSESWHLTL